MVDKGSTVKKLSKICFVLAVVSFFCSFVSDLAGFLIFFFCGVVYVLFAVKFVMNKEETEVKI